MSLPKMLPAWMAAAVAAAPSGCTLEPAIDVVSVSGTWALGPASGGGASVVTLDARAEGNGIDYAPRASADEQGAFVVAVDLPRPGDFRLCISPGGGARYRELAASVSVPLGSSLCTNLIALRPGEGERRVVVTPVTTWITALTDAFMDTGFTAADAHELAESSVESWLDCLDIGALSRALPAGRAADDAAVVAQLGAPVLLYAFAGGLSSIAVGAASGDGIDDGVLLFNSSDLVDAIRKDLLDGVLDERSPAGPIELAEGHPWTADGFLQALVTAVHRFLLSEHNELPIEPGLIRQHLQCLGSSALLGETSRRIQQPGVPSVRIVQPAEGDVLTADQEVAATVTSSEPLVSVELVSNVSGGDEEPVDSTTSKSDAGTHLNGTLRIGDLVDGQTVRVSARATTDVGYLGEDSIDLVVNASAPELRLEIGGVVAESSVMRLEGVVRLHGRATDRSGVESVSMTVPVTGEIEGAGGVVEVDADTTLWPEGPHKIVLEAADVHGERAQKTAHVLVDNRSNGAIEATVSLGSPVRDAEVTAYELPTGIELGVGFTNEHGHVALELPDTSEGFGGYVELVVRDGRATDLIDGGDLPLRAGDALRVMVPYEPSEAGTRITGVSVNMVTTCASNLADIYVQAGKRATLTDNVEYAYYLFADHLSRAQSELGVLDSRYVVPSNMTTDWSRDMPFARRLGLAHVGVSWDAADHAHRAGRDHREYGLLDHMHRLCWRDLSSAQLSGADADGLSVTTVGDETLSPHSFRHDTARGIFQWLEGVLPHGGLFSMNQTTLRGQDFAQRGQSAAGAGDGYLHVLAENRSELFDRDVSPKKLDVDPPVVELSVGHANVSVPSVRLTLTADDGAHGSGVAGFRVDVEGTPALRNDGFRGGTDELDVEIPCNIPNVSVVATVLDRAGLSAQDSVSVSCDNQPPRLRVQVDGTLVSGEAAVPVSGTLAVVVTAEDQSPVGALSVTWPSGRTETGADGSLDTSVSTLDWAEGRGIVSLTASDVHGTSVDAEVPVFVDNYADGSLSLTVSLGAPVVGGTVRVVEVPGGAEIGLGETDETGAAEVVLADASLSFGGYLDVRVSGGTVADLMSDGSLALRASDLLRTVVSYAPTRDGTVLSGASVNLVTTCAAELFDVYRDSGVPEPIEESVERAYFLFGDHLSRAESANGVLDSRWVVPSDLTGDWSGDTPARRKLGLVHAGVAWDAARHAWLAGRDPGEYSMLDHTNRLCRRDLSSGQFSGMDGDGSPVMTLGMEQLGPDSFRYDKALGIFRWLDGVLPDGSAFSANTTHLRGVDFAQVGGSGGSATAGFLHTLAGSTNELFAGGVAPKPFDAEPPVVEVVAESTTVNDPTVTLTVSVDDGEHGTGIASLLFLVDGDVVDELGPVSSTEVTHPVTIPCNRDDVRLQVVAADGVGLTDSDDLVFACDDRKPEAGFVSSEYLPESYLDAVYSQDGTSFHYAWRSTEPYELSPSARAPGQPNMLVKYWDRLHRYSENVAVVKAWFSDTLQGGYVTQNPDLVVTYEYLVQRFQSDTLETVRQETSLPYPGDGGVYEVPIAYETLSPDLKATYVADRHVVRFRATDQVGNVGTLDYELHLQLRSPPVWRGACGITAEVATKDLESDSTHLISNGALDVAEATVSFPVQSSALTEPLHITVSGNPAFEMTPAELRWERWLYPRGRIEADPACVSDDFYMYWTLDRQIRGAQHCDSDHFGGGPNVNEIVDSSGPYGSLYRWTVASSPTVRIVDANGVVFPQLPASASTFLLPPTTQGVKVLLNAPSVNATLNGEPYAWEQYRLEAGDGSDITTQRYYFVEGFINTSNTRDGTTKYDRAYVYLGKLQGTVRFPELHASHPELPHVQIPVVSQQSCDVFAWHWDERLGERW